jgi:hypothetical protein
MILSDDRYRALKPEDVKEISECKEWVREMLKGEADEYMVE